MHRVAIVLNHLNVFFFLKLVIGIFDIVSKHFIDGMCVVALAPGYDDHGEGYFPSYLHSKIFA